MKKSISMLALALFLCLGLAAQPGSGSPAKDIEAKRVGVYTRVLNLTADEAQKFWPIFNLYTSEQEAIRRDERQLRKSMGGLQKASDADVEKALNRFMDNEQKLLDLKRRYIGEFKKILPIKKVALMQRAEREFKKELLRDFRNREADE